MKSKDYHDYVIKDGKFIGNFEEMYQNVEDPWLHGKAAQLQYDIALQILNKQCVCKNGGSVLDLGCGKGAFTFRLKNHLKKAKILALDISETAIKKARKKNKEKNLEFEVLDIQKNYTNIKGKFDLVVMSEIMWYILPELEKILSHISKNLLKKSGCLLVNQAFYKAGVQKYGNEFIQTPEDFIRLTAMDLLSRIDVHKEKDFDSIMLFKNDKK